MLPFISQLAVFMAASGVVSPIAESTVELRGRVPAICRLASSDFEAVDGRSAASISVFCNQREGAAVTATLLGGDPAGYFVSNGRHTVRLEIGKSFEVARYSDAFAGVERVTIEPVSDEPTRSPVVQFDILGGA